MVEIKGSTPKTRCASSHALVYLLLIILLSSRVRTRAAQKLAPHGSLSCVPYHLFIMLSIIMLLTVTTTWCVSCMLTLSWLVWLSLSQATWRSSSGRHRGCGRDTSVSCSSYSTLHISNTLYTRSTKRTRQPLPTKSLVDSDIEELK